MTRRLGLGFVALLVLAAVAFSASWLAGPQTSESTPQRQLTAEPSATSSFLAAYARGDLASADELASPLYRAEWSRRGLSLDDRVSLLPTYLKGPDRPAVWLQFTYVGGTNDQSGFGHLMYFARATGGDGANAPTVWRVDTDQNGRVIWLEMVGLLTSASPDPTTIGPTTDSSAGPLPPTIDRSRVCLVFGVRSAYSPEGYYALSVGSGSRSGASGCPGSVAFYSVDEDGSIRPGAWSYGQSQPGLVTYGHVVPLPTVALSEAVDSLRAEYLASLTS